MGASASRAPAVTPERLAQQWERRQKTVEEIVSSERCGAERASAHGKRGVHSGRGRTLRQRLRARPRRRARLLLRAAPRGRAIAGGLRRRRYAGLQAARGT
jgi:hypothetical protein